MTIKSKLKWLKELNKEGIRWGGFKAFVAFASRLQPKPEMPQG